MSLISAGSISLDSTFKKALTPSQVCFLIYYQLLSYFPCKNSTFCDFKVWSGSGSGSRSGSLDPDPGPHWDTSWIWILDPQQCKNPLIKPEMVIRIFPDTEPSPYLLGYTYTVGAKYNCEQMSSLLICLIFLMFSKPNIWPFVPRSQLDFSDTSIQNLAFFVRK
jgi:hypothetical protein